MKIYLAGPMRGYPEFNFDEFFRVAAELAIQGHEVFNPAHRDNAKHGVDISIGNETGSIAKAQAEHGFDMREALAADCKWICEEAEAIFILEGWQESAGAMAERAIGIALGLDIGYQTPDGWVIECHPSPYGS